MSPITHWQVGALLANARKYNFRERRLIMLAALAPDLDGLFLFDLAPDGSGVTIGMGENWQRWHHTFSHNVLFCLGIAIVFALYNRARRTELFLICAASALLQILLDVLTNDSSWPQQFLRPVTDYNFLPSNFIAWPYLETFQVIWLQFTLMALIFAATVYLYFKTGALNGGRTFLELISPRLDAFITDFIALPFTRVCVVCGGRAFYRATSTREPLCPNHVRFHRSIEKREPPSDPASDPAEGGGKAGPDD